MRKFLLSGVALMALGGVAQASITVITPSTFALDSEGAPAPSGTGTGASIHPGAVSPGTPTSFGPLGATGGLWDGGGGPSGSGAPAPLITFTLPVAGTIHISISDIEPQQGDIYQAAVDGLFVGETIHVAALPTGSATTTAGGSFTVTGLSAGTHTLGIEDITLSYEGGPGPFGGDVPPSPGGIGPNTGNAFDPAGFFYSITEETAQVSTPEPAAIATLGIGLLGLAGARRHRKR
jgi:hypothetical protein